MKNIVLMAALIAGSFAPALAQTTTIVDTNSGTTSISTQADVSNLCPNQVVYEKRCLAPQYVIEKPACAAPMVVESKRAHFLRFGLGPIIDLGLL